MHDVKENSARGRDRALLPDVVATVGALVGAKGGVCGGGGSRGGVGCVVRHLAESNM